MNLDGAPLRVAVVGARRRRMGTGPYMARFFASAGAEVVAIAGTSPATVAEARADLAGAGIAAEGHLSVPALLEQVAPDVLVVASPAEAHDEALVAAAEAGCHVLCEKPLVWGTGDEAARAKRHVDAFMSRALHLRVAAQWPFTLEAYRALHHLAPTSVPRSFAMHLSPSRTGRVMIPDAMPHVISMLAALAPGAGAMLEAPRIEVRTPEDVHVWFTYRAETHAIDTEVTLCHAKRQPRRAAYALDGAWVERKVEQPGYQLVFEAGEQREPLADPLDALVRDFIARVSSSAPPEPDPVAYPGTAHVAALAAAWPQAEETRKHPA